METSLAQAFEACRLIHKHHGTSYYFATRLFPKDLRLATHALYAFFRVPDEIVDNASAAKEEALQTWMNDWYEAHVTGVSRNPVLQATSYIFHKYSIPFAYSEAFLKAMQQDLQKTRYATYEELQAYMYGSAAVVGLMMMHVIGFSDPRAIEYAEKLGYAMQLTNFLRDIREDLDQRGRIYLPEDELERFGIRESGLASGLVDENWKQFMRFQIERADRLYEEANQGIQFLRPRGRLAVRAGSDLYRMILRKIEGQGYDVFKTRARTSGWEKLARVVTTSLWNSHLLSR